ncbi:ParM/StbA family protein [Aggregatilinea lenta]|uniref:ParM/StbA family protein n=1 Tax=Aggregatilinea lenta TaxID=913108 RepID=UPI000E5A6F4F|nr:ParM/StbA family protein [Aggregatilinea lenta]
MGKRLLSVDIGNVNTKAVSSRAEIAFPSFVAMESGALDFDGLTDTNGDLVIEYEGSRLALGHTAFKLGRMDVSQMGRYRVEGESYRQLFAGAMVSVLHRSTDLGVVASLPVRFYMNARDEVRKRLAGFYEITFEGQTYRFKLDAEDLHLIPEGFGSICYMLLNKAGQVVSGDLLDKRVAVIDIGGRTTDGLFFDNLELIPNMCWGIDKAGMSSLWQVLDDYIQSAYGRTLSPLDLDKALYEGYFMHGPERVSLGSVIDDAASTLAQRIVGKVNSEWDGGNEAELILITGGGAEHVGTWLPWKHAFSIDSAYGIKSHMANVVGAYRFGLMRGIGE